MHNSNNQQYEYQKVHQVTPEELQKTLVLNLADFEETARREKMTSKKPALIVALIGVFSIALGFSFPLVETLTAKDKPADSITENREEYEKEDEEILLNQETVICNFDKMIADGTHVTIVAKTTFRDGGIVAFTRTTTINPIPGNGFGPSSIAAINTSLQPTAVQIGGYSVNIKPTVEGGITIVTDTDYSKIDLTMFPQKNQTFYQTSVDYASNTPKEQVLPDMVTKGYTCP